ncbi:MAG: hypothetical protein K2X98_05600 [Alphaproteobacteria bacterium]|nr:hypothetical protein [Alphaproteobacteria bacterium]
MSVLCFCYVQIQAFLKGFLPAQAMQRLMNQKIIKEFPILDQVAAISCGMLNDEALLDLNYVEDSNADVDANFILTGSGDIIEIQACAEKKAFPNADLQKMMSLAQKGVDELVALQKSVLKI